MHTNIIINIQIKLKIILSAFYTTIVGILNAFFKVY